MQFLVYLTVLMLSISSVLLEVHWLTSPSPQPKPIVRTTNAPVPKVDGPNAALSPVYPKPTDTQRPDAGNAPQAQASVTKGAPTETAGQVAPPTTAPAQEQEQEAPSTPQPAAAPMPPAPPAANAGTPSPQTSPAETTGVAAREDNPRPAAADVMTTANHSSKPNEVATGMPASGNRCDVQACASAYRSFRASDCTYQPFEGARRFCGKPPIQTTAREQREQPERRRLSRDAELRYLDRPAARRQIDDDDSADDLDDSDRGAPILFFFGRHPRW
jgi:BA14K-like protein